MNKSSRVEARIDRALKQSAEAVFAKLGVSPSEAIRIFYKQVEIHNGFPFDVRIPTAETRAALEEAEYPDKLIRHKDADSMIEAWYRDADGC